jgi:hypothetical protein
MTRMVCGSEGRWLGWWVVTRRTGRPMRIRTYARKHARTPTNECTHTQTRAHNTHVHTMSHMLARLHSPAASQKTRSSRRRESQLPSRSDSPGPKPTRGPRVAVASLSSLPPSATPRQKKSSTQPLCHQCPGRLEMAVSGQSPAFIALQVEPFFRGLT